MYADPGPLWGAVDLITRIVSWNVTGEEWNLLSVLGAVFG